MSCTFSKGLTQREGKNLNIAANFHLILICGSISAGSGGDHVRISVVPPPQPSLKLHQTAGSVSRKLLLVRNSLTPIRRGGRAASLLCGRAALVLSLTAPLVTTRLHLQTHKHQLEEGKYPLWKCIRSDTADSNGSFGAVMICHVNTQLRSR